MDRTDYTINRINCLRNTFLGIRVAKFRLMENQVMNEGIFGKVVLVWIKVRKINRKR